MSITKYRLALLNAVYKIKEILLANSIYPQCTIVEGYPTEVDLKSTLTWPIISVEIDGFYGRDVELGSAAWPTCQLVIDIFAKTDSQRDDLGYILWDGLREDTFTFYDFNSGFPVSMVDYSGILNNGDWYVENLTINKIIPVSNTVIEGEKHHSVIDGIIYLPNT